VLSLHRSSCVFCRGPASLNPCPQPRSSRFFCLPVRGDHFARSSPVVVGAAFLLALTQEGRRPAKADTSGSSKIATVIPTGESRRLRLAVEGSWLAFPVIVNRWVTRRPQCLLRAFTAIHVRRSLAPKIPLDFLYPTNSILGENRANPR
jgi:hypothetical protein